MERWWWSGRKRSGRSPGVERIEWDRFTRKYLRVGERGSESMRCTPGESRSLEFALFGCHSDFEKVTLSRESTSYGCDDHASTKSLSAELHAHTCVTVYILSRRAIFVLELDLGGESKTLRFLQVAPNLSF